MNGDKPKILVFDDDEDHREIITQILEIEDWKVVTAANAEGATTRVNDLIGPAVVLLDRNFKNRKGESVYGEQLLSELNEHARYPIVTFFFSADHSDEAEIEALDAGAYGYIKKGEKVPLILAKVRRAAAFVRQRTEPTTDLLTGVLTRRYALDQVVRELYRSERERGANACIMIDVNNLKIANDRYGHHAGDALIKAVVVAIKHHIRPTDVICRWGGDEFLIFLTDLLRGTSKQNTQSFVDDFLETLAKQKVLLREGLELSASASVGFSVISYNDIKKAIDGIRKDRTKADEALQELAMNHIKLADQKMYNHKQKIKLQTKTEIKTEP